MKNWWEINRKPFTIVEGTDDYSGKDFDGVYIAESSALSRSFFNGVTIKRSIFLNMPMDQVEFAEAHLSDIQFVNVDLSGSDFVGADFEDVHFTDCNFTDGEWRQSKFRNVQFTRCRFVHTTMNLCSFFECTFEAGSTAGLDYRAVNYNVFSHCIFEPHIFKEYVLARNFGLDADQQSRSLIPVGDAPTLEHVCLTSRSKKLRVLDLVDAIEYECQNFHGRLKRLRLEFISNIVSSLAIERRISASSLIYIEDVFISLAKSTIDESDFRAATSALINVRNALFDQVVELSQVQEVHLPTVCEAVRVVYETTFSQSDTVALVESLDQILFKGNECASIHSFRSGSTFLEIIFSATVATGAVLSAFNFILVQATISYQRLLKLRDVARGQATTTRKRERSRGKRSKPKLPAILRLGTVTPELMPVRRAVEKAGRSLVRLDDEANVELLIISEDETTEIED